MGDTPRFAVLWPCPFCGQEIAVPVTLTARPVSRVGEVYLRMHVVPGGIDHECPTGPSGPDDGEPLPRAV